MSVNNTTESIKALGTIDGLAATRIQKDALWIRSGEDLYAMHQHNSALKGPWKVEGASVGVDMALGWCNPRNVSRGDCLFIADISADTPVTDRAIYKVNAPDPDNDPAPLASERYPVVYELGVGEEAPDALALAVHPLTGTLYIITHEADEARVFEAGAPNAPGDVLTFRLVGKIGMDRPTSADISPDRAFLLVRNATDAIELKLEDTTITAALSAPSVKMPLEQDGGDSITYAQLQSYQHASSLPAEVQLQNEDIAPFEVYTAGHSGAQPLWRYTYPCEYPPNPEPSNMYQPDVSSSSDEGCNSAGTAAPAALLWLLAPLWARIRRRKDTH